MTSLKKFLSLSLLLLGLLAMSQSAKLPFQGKLLEDGLPVNGQRTLAFSMSTYGWTETHENIQIVNGFYSAILGSKTPLPTNLFVDSPETQLGISVNGTALSPVTIYAALAVKQDVVFLDSIYMKNASNDTTVIINSGGSGNVSIKGTFVGNTENRRAISAGVNLTDPELFTAAQLSWINGNSNVGGRVIQGQYTATGTGGGVGVAGYSGGGGQNWGVWGRANSNQVGGDTLTQIAVRGRAYGSGNSEHIGAEGIAEGAGRNIGVRGHAQNGTENWAGWFDGDVMITGKLQSSGSDRYEVRDENGSVVGDYFAETDTANNTSVGRLDLRRDSISMAALDGYGNLRLGNPDGHKSSLSTGWLNLGAPDSANNIVMGGNWQDGGTPAMSRAGIWLLTNKAEWQSKGINDRMVDITVADDGFGGGVGRMRLMGPHASNQGGQNVNLVEMGGYSDDGGFHFGKFELRNSNQDTTIMLNGATGDVHIKGNLMVDGNAPVGNFVKHALVNDSTKNWTFETQLVNDENDSFPNATNWDAAIRGMSSTGNIQTGVYGLGQQRAGQQSFTTGVYGVAAGNEPQLKYGVRAEVFGASESLTYGFRGINQNNAGNSTNFGADLSVQGNQDSSFTNTNYGLRARVSGVTGNNNYGVYGWVNATGNNNYGVYGKAEGSANNWAGYFDGDLHVTGNLTVDGNAPGGGLPAGINAFSNDRNGTPFGQMNFEGADDGLANGGTNRVDIGVDSSANIGSTGFININTGVDNGSGDPRTMIGLAISDDGNPGEGSGQITLGDQNGDRVFIDAFDSRLELFGSTDTTWLGGGHGHFQGDVTIDGNLNAPNFGLPAIDFASQDRNGIPFGEIHLYGSDDGLSSGWVHRASIGVDSSGNIGSYGYLNLLSGIDNGSGEPKTMVSMNIINDQSADPTGGAGQINLNGTSTPNVLIGAQSWVSHDLGNISLYGDSDDGGTWFQTNVDMFVSKDTTSSVGNLNLVSTDVGGLQGGSVNLTSNLYGSGGGGIELQDNAGTSTLGLSAQNGGYLTMHDPAGSLRFELNGSNSYFAITNATEEGTFVIDGQNGGGWISNEFSVGDINDTAVQIYKERIEFVTAGMGADDGWSTAYMTSNMYGSGGGGLGLSDNTGAGTIELNGQDGSAQIGGIQINPGNGNYIAMDDGSGGFGVQINGSGDAEFLSSVVTGNAWDTAAHIGKESIQLINGGTVDNGAVRVSLESNYGTDGQGRLTLADPTGTTYMEMKTEDDGGSNYFGQLVASNSVSQAGVEISGGGGVRVYRANGTNYSVEINDNASSGEIVISDASNTTISMTGSTGEIDADTIWATNLNYTGALNNVSDRRFKKSITNIPSALNKTLALNGVTYYWNKKAEEVKGITETRQRVGVIAQEVEAVMPQLVKTGADGYKSVDYVSMTALLIEAVKELNEKITDLEDENQELKAELAKSSGSEIDDLKAEIAAIKAMITSGNQSVSK
ncbi:MAG: tail fiber domain-containing protein [Cyclobacteriaceae bacterium]